MIRHSLKKLAKLEPPLHTLAQLKAGKLHGISRLNLSENLTDFPTEIYQLADSLEILDLSHNQLTDLPQDFKKLQSLKVLFLSNNPIKTFPSILASCPHLEMIGFKSCQLEHLPENAFPPKLRWLILTDNQLTKLPDSIGQCNRLEKLMLAGNQLQALPPSLAFCQNLALLRISANQLSHLPDWLLSLPKLAWLAFSGNPFCAQTSLEVTEHKRFQFNDFECDELLGQGASGLIYRARWHESLQKTEHFAVKLFKGQMTSDGNPEDELQTSLALKSHPNWIEVLGHFENQNSTNTAQKGLLMKLIPQDYQNLGLPPTLETCTRDTFLPNQHLSATALLKILRAVASAMAHCHAHEISHGDLYAHNILINDQADLLMGDFGAASQYQACNDHQKQQIQQVELKAFAHLIDDLLSISLTSLAQKTLVALKQLQRDCSQSNLISSLSFEQVKQRLQQIPC